MTIRFLLLGLLVLASGPAGAQANRFHPDVPAEMDVAGLHLVLTEEAQRLVQLKADALCRHQPSFQAQVNLADAAFPIIDQNLQQAGVPRDFRYLALQESSLRPDAQSVHDAVGYWQFKRETATGLGLRIDDQVDERKHLAASTRGAARYLNQSNASLHNWLDALLSYYTGLGGVKPYTLPTDAGATEMAITADTSPYVLMFLAQKVAYEPVCGLNPQAARLREFPATAGQTLDQQAQTLGVDATALAAHNRWLLAPTVPTDGRAYTLVVPLANDAQAASVLARQGLGASPNLPAPPVADARHPEEVRVNGLRALIALPGETTSDLASRGGLRLRHFLRDNELTAFDAPMPGRPYYLESKHMAADVEYYVVQANETVADIAQRYGLRRHAIQSKNHLASHEEPLLGRVLWLQHTRPRSVAIEYRLPAESTFPNQAGAAVAPAPQAPIAAAPAPEIEPAPTTDSTASVRAGAELPTPAVASTPSPAALPTDGAADTTNGWPTPARRRARPRPTAPVVYQPLVVAAASPLADEPTAAETPAAPEPYVAPIAPPTRPLLPAPAPVPARPVAPPVAEAPARPALPMARPIAVPRPIVVAPAPLPAPAPSTVPNGLYAVQPHEGVYAIARRYNLRPADLLAWNQLPPNASLTIGQLLRLSPPPAGAASTPPSHGALQAQPMVPDASAVWHAVRAGETLYSVARHYQVAVTDLQAWNHKPDTTVRLGEVLRVNAPPVR